MTPRLRPADVVAGLSQLNEVLSASGAAGRRRKIALGTLFAFDVCESQAEFPRLRRAMAPNSGLRDGVPQPQMVVC